MLASIRQFNKTVWLIILATMASRFTFFMAWPYLALILHQRFGLNEFQIGLMLTIAVTIGVLFGFYVGYLSDRYGRRRLMLIGIALNVVSMLLLSVAAELPIFMIATMGASIARSVIENPGRALLTDMLEDRKAKDMALHLRYFVLNVGAAFGPLAGVAIGATGTQLAFALVALVYFVYFIAASIIFRLERPAHRSGINAALRMRDVISVLRRDHIFLMFVAATFLANLTYGQTEAGLLQYLRHSGLLDVAGTYALLILTNGLTIVALQFPLLKLTENLTPLFRAAIGVALFTFGFIGFALLSPQSTINLVLSMLVLSVGEAILFPTLNVIVDHLAPDDMKGSYVGASSIHIFGFAFAPLFGGFLLFQFGGMVMWLTMAVLAIVVAVLFSATAGRMNATARQPIP
ncbi:MAG: MFS transporter [Hyphomicrobiaceae bacterium]|nr:MFS transporter [Hyphomicrobiaceae bacterium]MCC0025088.1 MFS transporter [Hyphomicrobiaceae bacterium]